MDKEVFESKIKKFNEGRKTKRPFVVVMKYNYGKFIANDYNIRDNGYLILWYENGNCGWRVGETYVKKIKFVYPLMDDEQYKLEGIRK
jgi:hypothetical protein